MNFLEVKEPRNSGRVVEAARGWLELEAATIVGWERRPAMPVREAPAQPAPPPANNQARRRTDFYPAQKARGGEIILSTPTRRAIFVAGLAGAIFLALLLTLLSLT